MFITQWGGTMAESKIKYDTSGTLTFTSVNSLASSTTLLGGAESASFDNTTTLYQDVVVGMTIKMGASTPTVSKSIEVWLIPILDGTPTWPDVFDGTDSAETVTSRNVLFGAAKLAKVFTTDATANQEYEGTFNVADICAGIVPPKFSLFVVQDSGQALASSGNVFKTTGITFQSV